MSCLYLSSSNRSEKHIRMCRYERVVGRLVRGRMSFFDSASTGRTLKHLSGNTRSIDEQLPKVLGN